MGLTSVRATLHRACNPWNVPSSGKARKQRPLLPIHQTLNFLTHSMVKCMPPEIKLPHVRRYR